MSNEIDKKLFKQIFGNTLEALANNLIDTTKKEKIQIIVKNINKNNFMKKMKHIILRSNQTLDVLI